MNAAEKDNMNLFNGLSSTIVDYIQNFFQCRHCAKNFQHKVRSIKQGVLPVKSKDTMMWLWQIHNMANVKLAGMCIDYCIKKLPFYVIAAKLQNVYIIKIFN